MLGDVYVSPCCVNCGRVVGELDEHEKEAFLSDGWDSCLCFDCDPDSASTTPSIFWRWQEGDGFNLDGVELDVKVYGSTGHLYLATRAHEGARARVLSSYTYLNRNLKNSALLGNGLEVSMCPVCFGDGVNEVSDQTQPCCKCSGLGTIPVAVVIPLWLIQEGENNV